MPFSSSTFTMTAQHKFRALVGAFAVKIARANNDPLYAKMIKFKKAYLLTKKQVMLKYGAKAQSAARQAATGR